jgi:hypothetical protein
MIYFRKLIGRYFMRDLKNLNHNDAEKAGWRIIRPLNCEVVGKAIYDEGDESTETVVRIMKSTKRFRVPGGWIYNTSTEYHKTGYVSVAEALVFVPEARV